MSPRTCLDHLRATCHGCNGVKARGKSHCPTCYRALPKPTQRSLYLRMGEGYEQVYAETLNLLRRKNSLPAFEETAVKA